MRRKTTLWTFEVTNKRHPTRDNIDKAKAGKPSEKNLISINSNTKQRHKDQQYQSNNREDSKKEGVGYAVIETKRSIIISNDANQHKKSIRLDTAGWEVVPPGTVQ